MDKLLQSTLVICSLLCLWSCRWNAYEPIARENILGEWSLYELNGEIVPTDSCFYISFCNDGTGTFAVRTPDKHWNAYERTFDYDEFTCILNTKGEFFGQQCEAIFKINHIYGTQMQYTVESVSYDGVKSKDNNIVTLRKLKPLLREEFLGLWEGYEINNEEGGKRIGDNRRWEYFDDGSFNYYHEKSGDEWQLKNDNDGHFALYGDFLATTYQNDINEGTTGVSCECWCVTISGNTMNWWAKRNNKTHRFRMQRVEE